MANHFAFTKLVVGDLARCATFYETVAELMPQDRIDSTIAGRKISEIVYTATAKGAGNFVLLAYHDTASTPTGETMTGFMTRDIGAFVERARTHGGAVTVEPYISDSNPRMKVGFVTDPEGHVIEVIQML